MELIYDLTIVGLQSLVIRTSEIISFLYRFVCQYFKIYIMRSKIIHWTASSHYVRSHPVDC